MSISRKLFAAILAVAGFLLFGNPARAQFDVGATVAPTNSVVSTAITYTINITNVSGFQRNNVYVTNALSSAAVINSVSMVNSAGNALPGEILTNSTLALFRINSFIAQDVARLTLVLSPSNIGLYTNQITVTFSGSTSNVTGSVVSTITPPIADLAVGMTNQASGVLVGDPTVIGLSVTNLGPITATGVVLSNTMPTSFKLLSISPTNSHTFTNGNLVLNLGTLTNGATRQFQVAVQPTNAVTNFNLIASVSSPNILDTNSANSVVTNAMTVSDFLSTNLTVTVVSQQFNPQTGLLEMNVLLANNGTNVPAARIVVSGLTNGARLYNGVGTNNGAAYVLYNEALATDASVPLLLEYYVLIRSPMPTNDYNLQAFGVPAINLSAGTNGVDASIKTNSSGGIMIEFAATPGKTYTIVYASDTTFSNALTAQPSIVAPANRVQWIDNGPPKTISHPSSTLTNRFYRVFQSQ